MKLLIFANCQGKAVSKILKKLAQTTDIELELEIETILNYEVIQPNAEKLPLHVIDAIGRSTHLLWQPLGQRWGEFSRISRFFPPNNVASFPYIYIDGLWPCFPEGDTIKGKDFPISVHEQYPKTSDYLREIDGKLRINDKEFSPLYSHDHWLLRDRLRHSVEILKEKDKACNIPVTAMVTRLISRENVFYTQNHPNYKIITAVALRVIQHFTGKRAMAMSVNQRFEAVEPEPEAEYLYGTHSPTWPILAWVPKLHGFSWPTKNSATEEEKAVVFYMECAKHILQLANGPPSPNHCPFNSLKQIPIMETASIAQNQQLGFATSSKDTHLGGNIQYGDPYSFAPKTLEYLTRRYAIRSAVDLGSGEGHQASLLSALGVCTIAVDGLPENVQNAVHPTVLHDLTITPFIANVDAVFCCEVVEHIEERYIDNLLASLLCGRILIMTHASPGQHGHHHVNEQPAEYWISRIGSRGFTWSMTETANLHKVAQNDVLGSNWYGHSGLVFFRNR